MSETKPPLQPAEAPDPDRLTIGVKEREDVNVRLVKVLSGLIVKSHQMLNRISETLALVR